jgi:hypothetical protein
MKRFLEWQIGDIGALQNLTDEIRNATIVVQHSMQFKHRGWEAIVHPIALRETAKWLAGRKLRLEPLYCPHRLS